MRVAVLCSLAFVAGCLTPPALPPRTDGGRHDAGLPGIAFVGVDVTDARGRAWPASAIPRTPTIRVTFTEPPTDASAIVVLAGDADADLADDLGTAPLRTTTLARAIAATRTAADAVVTFVPSAPLAPGSHVTVAVPAWIEDARGHRLDGAITQTLVVSADAAAGARATDAWPPDGAFDVAPALALAAVRLDGTIDDPTHAVRLATGTGAPVATTASVVSCAEIGWPSGACVALVPAAPLAPSSAYVLSIVEGARDATGAPIPAFSARFGTGATAATLSWAAAACAIGETASDAGCTRGDDESVSFHGQLSGAARLAWHTASAHGTAITSRGDVALWIGDLAPGADVPLDLDVRDYAGAITVLRLPLATTEPLATLSITEVRADPAGVEPRQEYVEIENYGAVPVPLAGMHLADAAAAIGDALPATTIPAGARALIVASGFAPDDDGGGGDVPAPAGALLVRVDASLASGGLSNAGEPLFLRDALDRWLSAAPATPAPREGVCIVRAIVSPRVGTPGSFRYDPLDTCTPGR